ncbi:unnamed protein product [Lampetra fluviatilis]
MLASGHRRGREAEHEDAWPRGCEKIAEDTTAMELDVAYNVVAVRGRSSGNMQRSQSMENGVESVFTYGSRVLSPAEQRYCVMRHELLAIVQVVQQYRPYLYSRQFMERMTNDCILSSAPGSPRGCGFISSRMSPFPGRTEPVRTRVEVAATRATHGVP